MNEHLIVKIIENHTNGYVILNQEAEVVYANKAMKQLTENNNDLFGNFMRCQNTADGSRCFQNPQRCSKCLIRKNLQKILVDKEKKCLVNVEFKTVDATLQFDCFMDYIDGYVCIEIFNLTEKNPNLFVLEKVLDKTSDLVFYKDSSLTYRYTNEAYGNFLGKAKDDIVGKTDAELLPSDIIDECLESDLLTLECGVASTFVEIDEIIYAVSKKKINDGIFATAKDVTKEYKIGRLAFIDELTGLANRRQYLKDIAELYQTKPDDHYLALLDMDRLRELNNEFGHLTGDLYLETLGECFSGVTHAKFYRLAGDEFAAILWGSKEEINQTFSELYQQFEKIKLNPKLTISTGVKKIDYNLSDAVMYEITDKLLYEAKNKGRNQFCLCDSND